MTLFSFLWALSQTALAGLVLLLSRVAVQKLGRHHDCQVMEKLMSKMPSRSVICDILLIRGVPVSLFTSPRKCHCILLV